MHQVTGSGKSSQKRIFVAMPFRPEWSEAVHQAIVEGCVSAVGSNAHIERADQIARPGSITEQTLGAIIEADLIVADVTGANGNVMYELGYADALSKPVVLLNQEVERSPFDIRALRQINYAVHALAELSDAVSTFVTAVFTPGITIATRNPRQPLGLAPTILRPESEHPFGAFSSPLDNSLQCMLVNEGPNIVTVSSVVLRAGEHVMTGHPCSVSGSRAAAVTVPVHRRVHLAVPASAPLQRARETRDSSLVLEVGFQDPRAGGIWRIDYDLRRGADEFGRPQWNAVSQSNPHLVTDE